MDTVQLLQAQLDQLNDTQALLFYCSLFFAAVMGFSKGGQR